MESKCPSMISLYILFSSHVCFCSILKWYNQTYVFLLFIETSQTLGFCSLQIKQIHRWGEENDLAASQNHQQIFSTVSVSRNTLAKTMWETCRKFFMPSDRNTRCNLKRRLFTTTLVTPVHTLQVTSGILAHANRVYVRHTCSFWTSANR